MPTTLEFVATCCFALAVIHTFMARQIEKIGHRYPEGSIGENLFHFLGEIEIVFGLWACVFFIVYVCLDGFATYDDTHRLVGGAVHYLESQNFTEPLFVFVIMCIAGTRPVIIFAEKCITLFAKLLPVPEKMGVFVSTLVLGPLLGSFITEPAAMTVTALILLDYFYSAGMSRRFMYMLLGLLFVNISIGGTLTHFAAPPVLMVAHKWHWGVGHMMTHFGYKAIIAVIVGTAAMAFYFRKELSGPLEIKEKHDNILMPPWWMTLIHMIFLGLVVYSAHHPVFFIGLFLFFLGFHVVTFEYQDEVKLKESLLVGFFLAGLVALGSMQAWWIRPLLANLGDWALYLGAVGLTAITDNAALTYLGSLAPLSDSAKYNLVAGAVSGGGLTVIANAPNPAGFGILKASFGKRGISPFGLFLGAIPPTILCIFVFRFL